MVKKITISVPDELHKRMMKYRDRFNFSKLFQKAMSKRIERIENFLIERKEDLNMEAIVERLRQEKDEVEANWFEEGKKDGFEWAADAHYSDIKEAVEMEVDRHGWPYNEAIRDYLETARTEWTDEVINYRELFDTGNEITLEGQKYLDGFQKGVGEFWSQVKNKI